MATTISFDDLMAECGILGRKEFRRFLKAAQFGISADYDKKTADLIAARFGLRIPWHKYRHRQPDEHPVEPFRPLVLHDLIDQIERWYKRLVPATPQADLARDYVLGLVCAGGFLEGAPGHDFLISFNPGTNVLIGDRGSGKSTVLNLLGSLAGSDRQDTHVLVRMLLTSVDTSGDGDSPVHRFRQVMRDYGLTLFVCYVCRQGTDMCSVITKDRNDVLVRQDTAWSSVAGAHRGLDLPALFFRQGEVTKISELDDEYYLNKILDSVSPTLSGSREQLARTLNRLKEQHYQYTRPARPFNRIDDVADFIAQRREDLSGLEINAKDDANRPKCLDLLERWLTIYVRLSPPLDSAVLSLLTSGLDDDLYWLFLQPIIGSVHWAIRALRGDALNADASVGVAIRELRESAALRLQILTNVVNCYSNVEVACDDSLRALAQSYANALEERVAFLTAQESECQSATDRLKSDGVDLKMYTLDFAQRVAECQDQIAALNDLGPSYTRIRQFPLGPNGEVEAVELESRTARYRATVGTLLQQLEALSEWDAPASSAHSFLFDPLAIDLRQGEIHRGFGRLSFGQRCGIILKLALLSDDKRILILDQPEDHLDAYSILRLIAPALKNVAEHRQVIIATHNSTVVLGLKPDRLIVLEPDGSKGRIRTQGALSEPGVAQQMLDILEGREETFRTKIDLYEDALRGLDQIDEASARLIESSFRRRDAGGHARPRRYAVLIADTPDHISATVRVLEEAAATSGIRLDTTHAVTESELFASLGTRSFDAAFIDYPMASGGGEPLERFVDPFGNTLLVAMHKWTTQHGLGLLYRGRSKAETERLRFLRRPFDSVDLVVMLADMERYLLGRPYPFPLAYSMRSVTGATTAQGRLGALKDVVESIVKYAVVVLMADAMRAGVLNQVGLSIDVNGDLTLGSWFTLLRDLLRYWSAHADQLFMPELLPLLLRSDGSENGALRRLSEFKDDVRDPVVGHGLQRDESFYSLLWTKYEDKIRDVYEQCLFMARYHLVAVESTDVAQDDAFAYQLRVLMGSDIRFNVVGLKSNHRLRRRQVYLWRHGGAVLPLDPFAVLATCAKCGGDQFYLPSAVRTREHEIAYTSACTHNAYTGERRTLAALLASV